MAGLAIYNDLQQIINTGKKLDIDHFIESVKILPSTGENDEELYGYILEEAIYKAEIENPELNRVFCMAVTADNYILNTGAPSSWSASQLMSEYPEVWPETIRALIIHSAEWTDKMKEQFLDGELKSDYLKLLRTCGYGVPNLERAKWSYENAVNLIIEDEIQPFEKGSSNYRSKEMNLYKIPWPKDVLLSLAEIEVKMKLTLSYFIEPGPGEIGWKDRYRYPSALLRFDLKRPDEDEQTFLSRINRKEKEKNDNYNNTTTT
ncbi:hypothetical protein C7954_11517 [Halanaerobium congolense]|uniref:Peptidase S8/S53 domain-containing protein n=1 Tax=Halanaerobium congolense TaxID=54121 RepID=A0A4R8GDR6_9FIRM|nr:hypothetical protein C7954_11517 [Halanaerobium congolense]